MRLVMMIAVLVLASCGADGPPERPQQAEPATGLVISGQISAGIGYCAAGASC